MQRSQFPREPPPSRHFALLAVVVSMTFASPPSGVTPTLLARGSYSDFKVASNPDNGGMFKAEAKGPIDVVVRQHDYVDGGSTGWHQHPYPVFITVTQGTAHVLRRERPDLHADPSCRRAAAMSTRARATWSATRAAPRPPTSA